MICKSCERSGQDPEHDECNMSDESCHLCGEVCCITCMQVKTPVKDPVSQGEFIHACYACHSAIAELKTAMDWLGKKKSLAEFIVEAYEYCDGMDRTRGLLHATLEKYFAEFLHMDFIRDLMKK